MTTLMKSKIMRQVAIEEELVQRDVFIFTPRVFQRIFNISSLKTKYILESYTKGGLLIRLKKGLYGLKSHLPKDEEIANVLYKPSYISFEYVLARYGIIPESVYTITSATTKTTREFTVKDKAFSYFKIKKQAFTGYALIKERGYSALIAEPEKALVDFFYFISLGKKLWNDRLNTSKLSKEKIMKYAKLYQRPGLIKLLEKI